MSSQLVESCKHGGWTKVRDVNGMSRSEKEPMHEYIASISRSRPAIRSGGEICRI